MYMGKMNRSVRSASVAGPGTTILRYHLKLCDFFFVFLFNSDFIQCEYRSELTEADSILFPTSFFSRLLRVTE